MGELVGVVNGYLLEISMSGRDGLKGHGDPFGPQLLAVKQRVLEFCRFREVNRSM